MVAGVSPPERHQRCCRYPARWSKLRPLLPSGHGRRAARQLIVGRHPSRSRGDRDPGTAEGIATD